MKNFNRFYKENKQGLFGYFLRRTGDYDLAADMMQESFEKYFKRYGGREANRSLLYTIGRNTLIDHIRRQRPHTPYDEKTHGRNQDQSRDMEQSFLVKEESRHVLAAFGKLDKHESDLLGLVVSSGLSYREIAEITGISHSNVKVKVHRARAKLRQILRKEAP